MIEDEFGDDDFFAGSELQSQGLRGQDPGPSQGLLGKQPLVDRIM